MSTKETSVVKNFSYQVIYQIIIMLMPFVTAPYIARVLGKVNNGIYSYTYVIVNYFVIFAVLGLESYGNRTIAKAKTIGQEMINQAFSEVFSVQISISLLVFFAYLIYIFAISKEYRLLLVFHAFTLMGSVLDIGWFFFGLEKFKLTTVWNIAVRIVSVTCIFVFVRDADSLFIYVVITALETFISKAGLWLFLKKNAHLVKIDYLVAFKKHLKPILVLFAAVFATSLYRMVDKLMLGKMVGMGNLGCYEYADKIVKAPLAVIAALGTVMLPRMSALTTDKTKTHEQRKLLLMSSKFVLASSFAMAFGVAGIAKEFVLVFLGNEYYETITILEILCISLPFMGWNNMVRTQVLMPRSKDIVYFIAVWIGAVINVIANCILIPVLGTSGAAIATVICYVFVSFAQVLPVEHEFHIVKNLKHGVFPLLIGLIMYVVVRITGEMCGARILTLFIQVFSGMITFLFLYFVYLYIIKDEFGSYIFKYFERRKNE